MLKKIATGFGALGVSLAVATVSFADNGSSDQSPSVPPQFANLAGCFEVTFRYVEDGAHDKVFEPVFEKVSLETSAAGIALQHNLILGDFVQRHWRETWTQNSQGLWTQEVVGPFDDFRYVCSAPWVLNQWTCDVAGTPKPRRDQDRDYAFLDRSNTLQVTPIGWIHMQRNTKRKADGSILATEIGWNEYKKVSDDKCEPKK